MKIVHVLLISLAACGAALAQTTSVNTPVSPTGATGATGASGGSGTTAASTTHLKTGALPPDVRLYANALGSRLSAPGLEQTTMTGTYTDSNGAVPMTLVWQNPGKVQVTLGAGASTVLAYAGASSGNQAGSAAVTGATSTAYQDLLETMTDDYPDAFFFNVATAGYRFLGARFRTDGGKASVYSGPYYDLCEKVGAVPSTQVVNQKIYFFDSTTYLLYLVRYQNGTGPSAPQVVVEFSNWKLTNGQQTPGTITRIVNGVTEFTLNLGSPLLAAAGSNSIFTTP